MTDRKTSAKGKAMKMVDILVSGLVGFLLGIIVGFIMTAVLIGDKDENDI